MKIYSLEQIKARIDLANIIMLQEQGFQAYRSTYLRLVI